MGERVRFVIKWLNSLPQTAPASELDKAVPPAASFSLFSKGLYTLCSIHIHLKNKIKILWYNWTGTHTDYLFAMIEWNYQMQNKAKIRITYFLNKCRTIIWFLSHEASMFKLIDTLKAAGVIRKLYYSVDQMTQKRFMAYLKSMI